MSGRRAPGAHRLGPLAPDAVGLLREGATVFRPSPWAALDAFAKAFLGLLPFVVILGLGAVGLETQRRDEAWWVLALENVQIAGALLLAFVPMVRILFTTYTVDDEGVRVRSQILATSDQRVSWEKVTALQHRRTLFDRLLRLERLDIVAYGMRGATLHLVGLREARVLRDHAARAMRRACSVEAISRGD